MCHNDVVVCTVYTLETFFLFSCLTVSVSVLCIFCHFAFVFIIHLQLVTTSGGYCFRMWVCPSVCEYVGPGPYLRGGVTGSNPLNYDEKI